MYFKISQMMSLNICLLLLIATAEYWKKPTNFNSTNLPPCDRLRKIARSVKSWSLYTKKV